MPPNPGGVLLPGDPSLQGLSGGQLHPHRDPGSCWAPPLQREKTYCAHAPSGLYRIVPYAEREDGADRSGTGLGHAKAGVSPLLCHSETLGKSFGLSVPQFPLCTMGIVALP